MEMKVAFTSGSLSRNAGGLFESVRALGKGLEKLGVDVSTYGLRDQNWERDKEAWAPLSAHAFSFIGPRALAWSPDMDAALDEARPDLVALQGLWQYSSLATRRQWRRKGTPYVVSPRGMLDKWALANSRWKKVMAAYAFENAVLRDASCLHALCVAEADAIRAYGLQQRIEVVPNGVELPAVLAGDSRSKTEDSRVGRRRLVFLGRIHPKKGLVGALRAWAKLRNSPSAIRDSAEWQFVIAGWDQGGHEAELKALCADLGLKTAVGTTKDTNIHENIQPRITRMGTDDTEAQGGAWASQAGAAFSNPSTSQLARDCENTSPTRFANGPAEAMRGETREMGSAGENQLADPKEFLDQQAGLQVDNQKGHTIRTANDPSASGEYSTSVSIRDIRGQNSDALDAVDVVFYGPAFGEEKEALLRGAEAFILPSFSEGLPMSVLEAWSYGLPVVMTPECNLPEGFACGAALEIRSGEGSFQDGMRILIEMTNQERAAMGMRGRRLVEERFTWPKVAARMKKIYETLL
jgi:glycosyltransferase involved in cell wall biosynthesis